ncbi:TonB-dependent siderophore receptor [Flavobacterium sp. WLB]|uniref:TonB-dependent siderophore receptor n=1 Tax=unclassified Flavobacterium TaxID=196869 RepID=UPI0006ABBE5F|nr:MULTISPECIES: TonB-dependent siderophore receptor [unclassified Flavobacterium]KOP39046.1 TonB-dependent receptor [Flavobacterium sp. VMW]OWU89299.1 TonB-dependent receptor [Flavobacterium sp. NLM]PUU68171.1 TonB-dependent siderophore receptor [Flavobacterium sp. WLB]
MKHNLITFLALLCFASSYSQNYTSTENSTAADTVKNKKGEILNEVLITANKPKKPVEAARSGIKVMDLPQSVQVIGSEVIEQQQAIRLSEVVKNLNGVYVGSARGGAQESFFSRGYDMSANNMFKNGFRYNAGSIPEVSSLEKVEFLKGGSALLYGNVAPGGIMNLVTKTPKFTSGGEVSMQMGSYSYYKPSVDFYGPLNKSIAYRFTGSYENSESFRDFVKNERIYINPSFLFHISDKTQITLQGDYLSADWTPDFGTGIYGKTILDLPRNEFFGALWSTANTKSSSASLLFNHDFNKNWKLNFNSSYQSYRRKQTSTAQLSTIDANGNWKRGLTKADAAEQIFGDQLSLQGNFNTGSIKHQIFTGVDYENSLAPSYTFGFYAPGKPADLLTTEATAINLYTYDYNTQSTVIPYPTRTTQLASTETQRFGAYFQDLVSINKYIKVLAGLRWSWQQSEVTTTKEVIEKKNNVNFITTAYEDAIPVTGAKTISKAFSPKAGLVVQPTKDLSLFASYSNSFTPNTGTTVDAKPLDPSIIDQYEVGVKKDFFRGLLTTNVTLYQITNNNLAQTAQYLSDGVTQNVNTNLKELVGATKGKGVEIDITATPVEGLNIMAGYSFNETKVSKSSGTSGSLVVGDILARTPKNTANLSFFYKLPSGLLKGVTFGAIGNYVGDRTGGWNDDYLWTENTPSTNPKTYTVTIRDRDIPLEGYVTVDASLGYEWKKFSILCRLSNITNELNYTVHENYSVNPIAPRQIMTSLRYKF